jgi:molybdopterin adenylyltransferase
VQVAVITVSDRAFRGAYEDLCGPEIERGIREAYPDAAVSRRIVPDEAEGILAALEASAGADCILTTGGTGIGPRDVTPEATRLFLDKEVPGIAEALRARSLEETPFAALSRGLAGIRGRTIVVNLPGSPKAVRLGVRTVVPLLEHALRMLRGEGHG